LVVLHHRFCLDYVAVRLVCFLVGGAGLSSR
jgi:hypothetical protein